MNGKLSFEIERKYSFAVSRKMSKNLMKFFMNKSRGVKNSNSTEELPKKRTGSPSVKKFSDNNHQANAQKIRRSKSVAFGNVNKVESLSEEANNEFLRYLVESKMSLAKAQGKTVSLKEGKLFIDYEFVCQFQSE